MPSYGGNAHTTTSCYIPFLFALGNGNYPVNISHAEYAKYAKTMQGIYPFSIKYFAKTYITSLVCNNPDGKAQAVACAHLRISILRVNIFRTVSAVSA